MEIIRAIPKPKRSPPALGPVGREGVIYEIWNHNKLKVSLPLPLEQVTAGGGVA